MNRYILTIATGKKLYTDMAANLARSFFWWHADTDIIFRIVTDIPNQLPQDVTNRAEILTIKPGEFGQGFSSKLHLEKLAGDGPTLFIDSDCLVYGNLDSVFDKFKGHSVSVVGNYISDGNWFGDVAAICKKFNVPRLPKFNGGMYYIEPGDKATEVYAAAQNMEKKYDEIGFTRLRGRPNDEVLMALAMALHGQTPIPDDGSILAEFVNFQSGIRSDLLNGVAELCNDADHPLYQSKWSLSKARPAVVHFLGHHNQVMPYIKEVKQLQYLFENKWPENIAKGLTLLLVTMPFNTAEAIKGMMRPLYRAVFGNRKIKRSERIVD